MDGTYAILSLVLLVFAIFLGFWKKINIGVIAIAFALVLGKLSGLKDSAILGCFSSTLFLRLLGIMLLFSVAQCNGTIEKLTKKLASLSGNMVRIIPIIIYVLFWVLSAVGVGGPAALALVAMVTVPIAYQLKISPMKLAPAGWWGGLGGMTSLNTVGILAETLSEEAGIEISLTNLTITTTVAMTIIFAVWYVGCGWLWMKLDMEITHEKSEPFSVTQYLTMGGVAILVILTLFLKVDIGLAGFACSFLLFLIPGIVEERKAISSVPWNTLVMIGGMGILISIVQELGGIDLLSNGMAAMMNEKTAPGFMSAMGSVMSAVSSTTGVVMPTLIPTVPGIVENVGGNAVELVYAVILGASQTAVSPLSTGGALMLAAYSEVYNPSTEERSKMFIYLLTCAIITGVVSAIFGFVGLYGFFL